MSIGPVGDNAASAAGVPYALARGTDAARGELAAAARRRELHIDGTAEMPTGVSDADADLKPNERLADGRRDWEETHEAPLAASENASAGNVRTPNAPDAMGERGAQLDLLG